MVERSLPAHNSKFFIVFVINLGIISISVLQAGNPENPIINLNFWIQILIFILIWSRKIIKSSNAELGRI